MMAASGLLLRRPVVAELLRERGELLVVSGLGAPSWDVAAAGDDPRSFTLWGAMGGAAAIGLGLALAQPGRRVLVITGDGEMLMGLGTLATIGMQGPANLTVVTLDNERFGETGAQRTHTAAGIDLAGIAAASRVPTALTVRDAVGVSELRRLAHEGSGPIFGVVKIDPGPEPLTLPPAHGDILTTRFRHAVLDERAAFD